jgi:hypothetical protein
MTSPATVKSIAIPPGTAIHAALPGAQFFDAYEVADLHPTRTALQTWLDVVARTPRWTQQLMALRNRLVRLVGLKDLGQLHDAHPPASGHAPSDAGSYRVGIFLIRHLSDTEVVLGQDDKHLDVQVSLSKHRRGDAPATLAVSTVVHIHNALGQTYMAVVTPFHRRIVRAMLQRLADHGQR